MQTLRACLAAAAAVTFLNAPVGASEPESHDITITATPGTQSVQWTGTVPFAPTGAATNSCDADPSGLGNDVHTINVAVADNIYLNVVARAEFRIDWEPGPDTPAPTSPPDLVLTLQKDDTTILSSDGGEPNESIFVLNPTSGAFSALACSFAALPPGTPYTGTFTVTVDEGSAFTAPPSVDAQGLAFSASLVNDLQHPIGEPLVEVDKDGVIYTCGPVGSPLPDFAQASLDGGDQFNLLGERDSGRIGIGGGGDCALATGLERNGDGNYQLAYAGLTALLQYTVGTSPDRGQTFTASPLSSSAGVVDRQWLAFTDADTVFMLYNQYPISGVVQRSDDGGLTYTPAVFVSQNGGLNGPIRSMEAAINPTGNDTVALYYPWTMGNSVKLAISFDAGDSWNLCTLADSEGDPGQLFPVADHDSAGNLYLAYTDDATYKTFMVAVPKEAVAQCVGSDPKTVIPVGPKVQMNRDTVVTSVMPWLVASGETGRVAVGFYGSEVPGRTDDPSLPHAWHVYVSQTLDALSAEPAVSQVRATTHPMHYDQICINGTFCLTGGDRGLADFFGMDYNPITGELVIVYNRTGKQPGDGVNGGPLTASTFMRQIGGPSHGGGMVAPAARPVLREATADPAGDAHGNFADFILTPTRVQLPALDVTNLQIVEAQDFAAGAPLGEGGFTVRMTLSDLSDAALSDALAAVDGQSLLWLFYYWDGFVPHTASARWNATDGFTFGYDQTLSGTLDCGVPEDPGVFGDICQAYPGATPLEGRADAATNTIELTLPLSMLTALKDVPAPERSPAVLPAAPGDRIYSAALYTFVNTTSATQDSQGTLMTVDNTAGMDFLVPGLVTGNPPPVVNPPASTTQTERFGGALNWLLLLPLAGIGLARRKR
jgi:hypothetical protein